MTTLQQQNTTRWQNMHISSAMGPQFSAVANKITANKAVYDGISKTTGVPWWFIGIVHYREASLSMKANLAQGDPWNKKSVHVPAGRGPFKSFEDAAVDALTNCSPYAARNKDWSIGGALTMLEKYNGLGYYNKGLPSPYVWAGTDQYSKGKYVADGVYDPNAIDKQLGCAGILKFLGVFAQAGTPAGTAATAGAGGAVIAGGAAMAATPHHYWPFIIGGVAFVITVGLIGYLIHSYKESKYGLH